MGTFKLPDYQDSPLVFTSTDISSAILLVLAVKGTLRAAAQKHLIKLSLLIECKSF